MIPYVRKQPPEFPETQRVIVKIIHNHCFSPCFQVNLLQRLLGSSLSIAAPPSLTFLVAPSVVAKLLIYKLVLHKSHRRSFSNILSTNTLSYYAPSVILCTGDLRKTIQRRKMVFWDYISYRVGDK